MSVNFEELKQLLAKTFTPRTPVSERDLFAGRIDQFDSVAGVISERGAHGVIFGERGVGKTSLANVVQSLVEVDEVKVMSLKVTCETSDTFSTIWHKAFSQITIPVVTTGIGFDKNDKTTTKSLGASLPASIDASFVTNVLSQLSQSQKCLVILDEFDRLSDGTTVRSMADRVKTLSAIFSEATLLIVGVADSIDQLIESHESTERAFVQIPMPRMSAAEILQIIVNGCKRLTMACDEEVTQQIVALSQGLPYITHLLCSHIFRQALNRKSVVVEEDDFNEGLRKALDQWQASIKTSYVSAVTSVQPQHIFKEVLLACAFAKTDELGYFSASAVRAPLQNITERTYDIPNFARHLKEFASSNRGNIIERTGPPKRLRYRFNNPLMRPYVILKSVADGLIAMSEVDVISSAVS